MNAIAPIFDKPQWTLVPDPAGRRNYANVSNAVEVTGNGFRTYYVHLAVPADLFTFMRRVLMLPPHVTCTLSIDVVESGQAVFSMLVDRKGDWSLYDLWAWRKYQGIPAWMLDRTYQRAAP